MAQLKPVYTALPYFKIVIASFYNSDIKHFFTMSDMQDSLANLLGTQSRQFLNSFVPKPLVYLKINKINFADFKVIWRLKIQSNLELVNKNENLRLVRERPVRVVEDVVYLNVKDLQEVVGGRDGGG